MSLKDTINAYIKAALLSGDSLRVETLKGVKTAVQYEEVAQKAKNALSEDGLSDAEIEQIFARESKKRDEAAELFERGGNQAAADKERAEKVILQEYLPQQLSEDDIRALVTAAITQTGATEPKDMGRVIGAVKAKAGNAADGAVVARLAKELLLK